MKKSFLGLAIIAVILGSCKKDPNDPQPSTPGTPAATTGSLKIELENMVDTNELVLNTVNYVSANGDTFTVSKFNYFISNIKLTKSDGSVYVESESYHLVKESDASSKTFTIANVPYGTYTAISFMIGVDSARNVSGAQTGALSQNNDMYWNWTTGYIMAKFEGTSPKSPATNHLLTYHMGGFKGVNSVLRTVTPSFNSSTATVSSSVTPEIHMKADLSEWFKNPTNNVNFATTHTIHMAGADAKAIADNYQKMFSVEHIHN
ncbi:MAG TPA: MbnP family protein [Bacteroidia bacterium]